MEKEKLGQEQAFADEYNTGISKRFYAACAAMQGILANSEVIKSIARDKSSHETTEKIIRIAYLNADELLKQEKEVI